MSRINVIEIGGHKVELFFSTWAMIKLSEMSGGSIENIGDWLSAGNTEQLMEKFNKVIVLLANAAIMKRNADISLGLEQGEKKELYSEDYFLYVSNAADIMEHRDAIFKAMSMGIDYEIPEGVEIEQKDPDLAEIEKEKKQEGRAAT